MCKQGYRPFWAAYHERTIPQPAYSGRGQSLNWCNHFSKSS